MIEKALKKIAAASGILLTLACNPAVSAGPNQDFPKNNTEGEASTPEICLNEPGTGLGKFENDSPFTHVDEALHPKLDETLASIERAKKQCLLALVPNRSVFESHLLRDKICHRRTTAALQKIIREMASALPPKEMVCWTTAPVDDKKP